MTDTEPDPDDYEDYDDHSDLRMEEEMQRGADIPPDPEDSDPEDSSPVGGPGRGGPMIRPVFGSQAADNAAWEEIRTAVATGLDRARAIGIEQLTPDEITAAVTPVLVRLVDQAVSAARREDGNRLNHVDSWDQVHMLVNRWLAGEVPCGATGRIRSGGPVPLAYESGPCLAAAGHPVPGHDDGAGGRW